VSSSKLITRQINIASRLGEIARAAPETVAVIDCAKPRNGHQQRRSVTFEQLDRQSGVIAGGLHEMGVRPGTRLALLVKPSIEFVTLTFALFKAGSVIILIDPGMGRDNLIDCLAEAEPEGFVAIPLAQAARVRYRRRFPRARLNVTVGRRWFWGGRTLRQLTSGSANGFEPAELRADDPAAIIFTTGSTGPPKGVLYSHGNFAGQVQQIQQRFSIQPGGMDLAGFPLFGLFNAAMGTTTVIPDMDASRPASLDPQKYVDAIGEHKINQSFASPAVWNVVARYCERTNSKLPSLKLVLSAGAPMPPHVLARLQPIIHPEGEVFTPYGATEALPVAAIGSHEILGSTSVETARGAGTCVGRAFSGIDWKVIRIEDGPIGTIEAIEELPDGEIGELIVRGPVVTKQYVTRREANLLAKITDGDSVWHRMGDVGYLDDQQRFWFCGRKAHRVRRPDGEMFTIRCEAIFNEHPRIFRSALVGLGPAGSQVPAMICEPWREHWPRDEADRTILLEELAELGRANDLTAPIASEHILLHKSLPVDIRHNAKIFREQLGPWAEAQLGLR